MCFVISCVFLNTPSKILIEAFRLCAGGLQPIGHAVDGGGEIFKLIPGLDVDRLIVRCPG